MERSRRRSCPRSSTLPKHWETVVCPLSLSPRAFTEVRYRGMSMQACFIPQQHETLRVQSCLCAAHYYGDGPALGLDVRPKSGDTRLDIPLHTTASLSEELCVCRFHHSLHSTLGVQQKIQEINIKVIQSIATNSATKTRINLPLKECFLGWSSFNLRSHNDCDLEMGGTP